MLAMLLPSRRAPINRSRLAMSAETIAASRLPCFVSRNMLARDAPVSAVSLAAKNADAPSSAAIMQKVSQSMARSLRFALQLYLQEVAHPRRIDIPGNHRAANGLKQDEGQLAAPDFLVLRHQGHQRVGVSEPFLREARNILQMGRQTDVGKMTLHARRVSLRDHAKRGGELRRQHHADRNAFAVEQPVGKAGCGFQRVAEGMTEIEQRTVAGFALVARHDCGLGAARGCNRVLARRTALEDLSVIFFQPAKEGCIAEHAVFGDFGITGTELARGERVEHRSIGNNEQRLVKCAMQILALW